MVERKNREYKGGDHCAGTKSSEVESTDQRKSTFRGKKQYEEKEIDNKKRGGRKGIERY